MRNIVIIGACDESGIIGNKNKLPWRIRSEMEYFLRRVAFKPLIMGKSTCLSLYKPINSANNYVLTTDKEFHREGFITVNSIEEMLEIMEDKEHFVVGGSSIYNQFLDLALDPSNDINFIVELSFITGEHEGDSYFPLEKLEGLHSTMLHKHSEGGATIWQSKAFYKRHQ